MMECKSDIFLWAKLVQLSKLYFLLATKEKMISRRMLKQFSKTARFSMKTTPLLGNVEKI